ncbi:MAG: ABC transporter permease [Eubacteriales bacterium]|mgnify:CR=1 FL=1|nr:ABC transporter permease [Eubacteriales bacterium]MCI7571119.1 ABC transporter permease [Clostridiales bacterium]
MKKSSKLLAIPLIIWLAVFVVVPFVIIIYYGVTVENDAGVVSVSFENLKRFADPMYLKVFLRSIKIALISTMVCLLIGYPVAYILSRSASKYKGLIMLLIMMPMWMNFLLRTYSWMSLLENSGIINSILQALGLDKVQFLYNEGAVTFGTVYNFLPFMIMPINTTLLKLDDSLLEAAYDLGAKPAQRFFRITLPFSMPGVLSGIAMVFVPSVTTFVISQLMGGGKVPLIGDIIEKQFRVVNDWHFGATISLVVMIVVLSFMFVINRTDKQDAGERSMIL